MSCSEAQPKLALLLYGELSPAERSKLEAHLATCSACRREFDALAVVRQGLGMLPAPEIRVDIVRVYEQAALQQQRRLRRWRRAAIAVSGIAALVAVVAFGLRFEAHVESHQFVLRWGTPPADTVAPDNKVPQLQPQSPAPPESANPVTADQIQVLSKLIRALVDDVRDLDRQRREDAATFQARLRAFQEQNLQRCADLQHSIDGLYVMSHKGE
jgi:anti-sigma factor RsiW